MPNQISSRLNLRFLILSLAFLSTLVTLLNALNAVYLVQRQQLIDHALEDNRVYAAKLAAGTEHYFTATHNLLAYSANVLAQRVESLGLSGLVPAAPEESPLDEALTAEVRRMFLQGMRFNSVVIVDEQGQVLRAMPETLGLQGQVLKTAGPEEALREQRPLVSLPYISHAGNLVVMLSHPIRTSDGTYLGYIAGTLYLRERNILYNLLGEDFHEDSTYTYVVDRSRQLLFHPNGERVGQVVGENPVIDAVLRGESGAQRVINSQGVDMLAGFAPLQSAGWGIVAQRTTEETLQPITDLMLSVLRYILPLGLVVLVLIWWSARLITRPLRRLAQAAQETEAPRILAQLQAVRAWYLEAAQLKRVMGAAVDLATQQIDTANLAAQTDPLTGLVNRRGLTTRLDAWKAQRTPFSVVALDIDHFKRVNDTFGHDVGDLVLKRLAQLMRDCAREGDILCRSGGEEFLVLLENTAPETAVQIADRLRQCVERTDIPPVGHITISLGVAHHPKHAADIDGALKAADEALYQAKEAGRNRVVMSGESPE